MAGRSGYCARASEQCLPFPALYYPDAEYPVVRAGVDKISLSYDPRQNSQFHKTNAHSVYPSFLQPIINLMSRSRYQARKWGCVISVIAHSV